MNGTWVKVEIAWPASQELGHQPYVSQKEGSRSPNLAKSDFLMLCTQS